MQSIAFYRFFLNIALGVLINSQNLFEKFDL